MAHRNLLKALLPITSYDPNAFMLDVSLTVEGQELDRVLADSVKSLGGLTPFTYQQYVADWERVYGLPHECSTEEQLHQERLELLAMAFQERSGISIAWLKRYALLAGYDIEIEEYKPFKSGRSRCGDKLTNGDWMYAFRVVNTRGATVRKFKSGRSVVGERLQMWGDEILECIINKYKPAHTVGLVAYV